MRLTRVIPALALAATALLGAAPGASAAAAVPSMAAGSIIAPCTPLQDGEYRYYGTTLTECKYVPGLGYYWVKITNSCGAAKPGAVARKVC